MKWIVLALLVLVVQLATAPLATAQSLTGRATVTDGDSLVLAGQRVRLATADAPELTQTCLTRAGAVYPCGRVAAAHLAALVGTASVTCRVQRRDRWNRAVAVCSAAGRQQSLGGEMVIAGWAVVDRRRGSTAYLAEERAARAAGRGVWQGRFEAPWAYRARARR